MGRSKGECIGHGTRCLKTSVELGGVYYTCRELVAMGNPLCWVDRCLPQVVTASDGGDCGSIGSGCVTAVSPVFQRRHAGLAGLWCFTCRKKESY